jgi:glycogen synthase
MRVLMFGWEFPPYVSGGLGTACFGMTQAMTRAGIEVIFVLPRIKGERVDSHIRIVSAAEMPLSDRSAEKISFPAAQEVRIIDSPLKPYMTESAYELWRKWINNERAAPGGKRWSYLTMAGDYGPDLMGEIVRYAEVAGNLAKEERFDVIHGHDWMTIPAGIHAKKVSGKPFLLHVHSLEYDRSGENINRAIYDMERYGLEAADHVFAVSYYTKNMIVNRYGIAPGKVTVVHNAVSRLEVRDRYRMEKKPGEKTVLFLGRITFQKGPDYFVEAAARVLQRMPEATFVMAGSGDMMPRMVERVAELRMGSRFHFTGFLRGAEVEAIYAMSDLYVMPSVSEPFGISPLEAILYDVPVIISKQSGVSEILRYAMKVDFWNVEDLADKIHGVLRYEALASEMRERCEEDLRRISWDSTARRIREMYEKVKRQ